MTYKEYREQREKEMNELPIFWAFSTEQFMEEMKKRTRATTVEGAAKLVYRFGNGGFYLKTDAQKVRDYFNKPDQLPELMKDYNFAFDAILYEMNNHEYAINWQADWDVCSCFGHVDYSDTEDELQRYFDQLGWEDTTRCAYFAAKKEHYKMAEENEWF